MRRGEHYPTVHGTLAAYTNHGCRCEPCTAVWTAYMRTWRQRRTAARKQGTR